MSTPEAQRKARKAYRDRKKEAGEKLVSFMLSAEAAAALAVLTAAGASKNAAINAALITAAKAVQKPKRTIREQLAENGYTPQAVKPKLDLPVGQQPFTPRLKGLQKERKK